MVAQQGSPFLPLRCLDDSKASSGTHGDWKGWGAVVNGSGAIRPTAGSRRWPRQGFRGSWDPCEVARVAGGGNGGCGGGVEAVMAEMATAGWSSNSPAKFTGSVEQSAGAGPSTSLSRRGECFPQLGLAATDFYERRLRRSLLR
ncbi:hypothetical protein E2562_005656 [Oryza meyeriana var. granulata]|uniref:Uncharacterized protein n=1 Tax=Oryza meyeriana var. granulata TaxID=110450 RepID=A0A6G1BIX3_9ORYZ|nr:hypothetical protein E2562_005656 [Oryza meyeriana var. granulata]